MKNWLHENNCFLFINYSFLAVFVNIDVFQKYIYNINLYWYMEDILIKML